jgi:hypothetical protein
MGLEFVEFDKRAAIEQEFHALARGHSPSGALALKAIGTACGFSEAGKLLNTLNIFFKTHQLISVDPILLQSRRESGTGYDATAEYINWAAVAERYCAAPRPGKWMSDSKISFMIGFGWVAALINAIASVAYAFKYSSGESTSYVVAAVFFVLAAGIFMRIDWCAAGALVTFIALRFYLFETVILSQQRAGNGPVILSFWISAILFAQLYVVSVIGTMLWNARHREMRHSLVSLFQRSNSRVNPAAGQ